MPDIYDRIEKMCRDKGINVTTMCTACGISRASLSDYKNGRKKSLSAETLSTIAEYFEVTVDYIYGGEAPAPSEDSMKVAMFGGDTDVTDEMWAELKRYARYLKEQKDENQ